MVVCIVGLLRLAGQVKYHLSVQVALLTGVSGKPPSLREPPRRRWANQNRSKVSYQLRNLLPLQAVLHRSLDAITYLSRLPVSGHSRPPIPSVRFEEAGEVKPAISTAGNDVGRKSQCKPLAAVIKAKAELGLSFGPLRRILYHECDSRPGSVQGSLHFAEPEPRTCFT
jgi:hypothetical protein